MFKRKRKDNFFTKKEEGSKNEVIESRRKISLMKTSSVISCRKISI